MVDLSVPARFGTVRPAISWAQWDEQMRETRAMLYEIRATQGDEYTEWIIDAPAHNRGSVPKSVTARAACLVRGWAEPGADMAEPEVTIGQLVPARVGYPAGNRQTSMFVELTSFPVPMGVTF